MNDNGPRFSRAFLAILIVASIVSIKMAYLYAVEMLIFLAFTVPAALVVLTRNNNRPGN
jgi:hypothetical protein